jgi:hypothetical protein
LVLYTAWTAHTNSHLSHKQKIQTATDEIVETTQNCVYLLSWRRFSVVFLKLSTRIPRQYIKTVSTTTELRTGRPEVRFPTIARNFFFFAAASRPVFGPTHPPAPYPMDTGGLFPGGKKTGA